MRRGGSASGRRPQRPARRSQAADGRRTFGGGGVVRREGSRVPAGAGDGVVGAVGRLPGGGGAVRLAVRGANGAPAVPSQLWAAAVPRWRRRAVSGGGCCRRRRRRLRAVAPRRRRRRRLVAAAAVAAVTDAVAGSSTTAVDARQRGRWPPQPPSIAVSWEAPRRRTRRRRPHLRPSAKSGGRQRVSLVGHSTLAAGNAFRPKLR